MRKSRYSEEQIIGVLRQVEKGQKVFGKPGDAAGRPLSCRFSTTGRQLRDYPE